MPGCGAGGRRAADPGARAVRRRGLRCWTTTRRRPRRCYRESLALCERLGDDIGVATASNDLGEIAREHGELEGAQTHYARALELWRAMGERRGSRAGRTTWLRRRAMSATFPAPPTSCASRWRRVPRWATATARSTLAAVVAVAAEREPGIRRRHALRRGGGGAGVRRDRARPDRRCAVRARRHAAEGDAGGAAGARGAGARTRAHTPADGRAGGTSARRRAAPPPPTARSAPASARWCASSRPG